MPKNSDAIIAQAERELNEEHFREAVEREKVRIRERRHRKSFFPWRVKIININKGERA